MMEQGSYLQELTVVLEAVVKAEGEALDRLLDLVLGIVEHEDVECHNHAASSGALELLCHLLKKSYFNGSVSHHQAHKLCLIVNIILRCSDECAASCLEKLLCDLLSCAFWILADYPMEQIENPTDSQRKDGAKAIIYRVSKLDISLLNVIEGKRLVRFLQQIIRDDQQANRPLACEAMRALDGLARHESSKVFLVDMPGLLYDIVNASTIDTDGCVPLDFFLIRFLRKITWDTRNKFKATKTEGFVELLLKCAKHQQMDIRKEALGVFWMLSFDAASVQILSEYPKDAAVQTLADAAEVPELRMLALQGLHRIVRRTSPRRKTRKLLLSNDALARIGCNADNSTSEVHQARLIETLCRFISVNESCHSKIIDALAIMTESASESLRFWAAKSFHGQALNKSNQFFLARSPTVLRDVLSLANDPIAKVREKATSVLLQLTSERSNAKILGLNYNLLETLLSNARSPQQNSAHYESEQTARLSIQGILSLASQEVSKERIAKHHACVSTLASFGVSEDVDVELKSAALHGVIMLVHLL